MFHILFIKKTYLQSISCWLSRLFSISSIKKMYTLSNGSLIIQSKWSSQRASGDLIMHVLQANVLLISWPNWSINKSIHAISAGLCIFIRAVKQINNDIKTKSLHAQTNFFVLLYLTSYSCNVAFVSLSVRKGLNNYETWFFVIVQ